MSTIKGYKPHDNQRKIHEAIRNEPAKYYGCAIGRQWGKTLMCVNQMLDWVINDPGCDVGWISPIYKQSKKVFREFERATKNSGLFEYNKSDLIIEGFGSTVQFFSAENADGIRGNTFHYLICDEYDFIKSNVWEEVLQPTVLVKGKKVVFISTPKGRKNMFKLKTLANEDDRYRYFHFTSYDNPLIDHRELEAIRKTVPDHIFKQEYLAEYIDNVAGLFKHVRDRVGEVNKGGKLYGGLDIGRADDYTVLTIGDRQNNVIFVERWRQDEWSRIIDKVAQRIKEMNALTYVEVNNQGDVFYEMLQKKVGNLIEPFKTTTQTKPIMIEDLAVNFEQGTITIPNEEWLIDELESFTYVYDPRTRRVKYSAPEGIHDDGVISLALYTQATKNLTQKGKYVIVK